mmetsp:Transcript_29324/g.32572  ORF Transcript_29324/g.32572 Transcript_29324/m.32572 type:complete len:766 (+) Transcript_29324:533-2830(+)
MPKAKIPLEKLQEYMIQRTLVDSQKSEAAEAAKEFYSKKSSLNPKDISFELSDTEDISDIDEEDYSDDDSVEIDDSSDESESEESASTSDSDFDVKKKTNTAPMSILKKTRRGGRPKQVKKKSGEIDSDESIESMTDDEEDSNKRALTFNNVDFRESIVPPRIRASNKSRLRVSPKAVRRIGMSSLTRSGGKKHSAGLNKSVRIKEPSESDSSESSEKAQEVVAKQPEPVSSGPGITEPSKPQGRFVAFISNHRTEIIIVALFFLITAWLFVERAYLYSVEKEHIGLRAMAGFGVTVSRGAAAAMSFCFALILLTMCRNTITLLRTTPLNRLIPFDHVYDFHKLVAATVFVFTWIHILGHFLNFFHLSTQFPADVECTLPAVYFGSTFRPSFGGYYLFGTLTGFTGLLMTLIMIVMYMYAIEWVRQHFHLVFWTSHHLYIVLYILMFLHGSASLLQKADLWLYLTGPLVLFFIDKVVGSTRTYAKSKVVAAEHLPSGVTKLVFRRDKGFKYQSGQWVRLSCPSIAAKHVFHPFTLTSAPHEPHLSCHIRAVGPWTKALRRVMNPQLYTDISKYPQLIVDGPYGEGLQDWYKFKTVVLVGAGIGITPFASILKDLIHQVKANAVRVEKVYFFWIMRSQASFEWMFDILKDVEAVDTMNILETHIFITQYKKKFDLRTMLFYVAEKNFHRTLGISFLTGLRATTHFGRPNLQYVLQKIQNEHRLEVKKIGVCSCGPHFLSEALTDACKTLSQRDPTCRMKHITSNFG